MKKLHTHLLILIFLFSVSLFSCQKDNVQNDFYNTIIENTITDIDGNIYKTILIGDNWWMAENLKVTHYNDGTLIPEITDDEDWTNLSTGAFCWYDNDESTYKKFGALYNWYAVESENLCPEGWHVATYEDWEELVKFLELNGQSYGGSGFNIAKALAAKTEWNLSDEEGSIGYYLSENNSSGFKALPGGIRFASGEFNYANYQGFWWTSTEYNTEKARYYYLGFDDIDLIHSFYDKNRGKSIRCVMNKEE